MKRHRFTYFTPDAGGGLASFCNDVVAYSPTWADIQVVRYHFDNYRRFEIGTINQLTSRSAPEDFVKISELSSKISTFRRLQSFVRGIDDIIVANDGTELEMIHSLGTENRSVFVLHGDSEYYFRLAEKYAASIDTFACVSAAVRRHLLNRIPNRASSIVEFSIPVRPGVPRETRGPSISLLYVGRLEEGKGAEYLEIIDQLACRLGTIPRWTIFGDGPLRSLIEDWRDRVGDRVSVNGHVCRRKVLSAFKGNDLLIFPSRSEGFGLVAAEAISAGVPPVVFDLDTGYSQLVVSGRNAIVAPLGDVHWIAAEIHRLSTDRTALDTLSRGALETDLSMHEPIRAAQAFWELCKRAGTDRIAFRGQRPNRARELGFLDRGNLPEGLTRAAKSARKTISKVWNNHRRIERRR